LGVGVRFNDIVKLSEFFARELKLKQEPIIGQNYEEGFVTVDIEAEQKDIYFQDILPTCIEKMDSCILPLLLGVDVAGEPVVADLASMPHILIGGRTGSGKSVALQAFVTSLLERYPYKGDLKLAIIDPKGIEFARYDKIEQIWGRRATTVEDAVSLLRLLCDLMEKRFAYFAETSEQIGHTITDLAEYRRITKGIIKGEWDCDKKWMKVPYIVLIIDELADLVMYDSDMSKEITQSLCRLAQKSRAVGIHIIAATQRPSREVVSGIVKANFPARIAFQVASEIDSAVVFGQHGIGAEKLLGKGDMLYLPAVGNSVRIQGPLVSEASVEKLVAEGTKVLKFSVAG
jgi:S-DNA-T family DNA segregation ATPase FtsK/SpoIIIE